jgi:hypothetical protein
MATDDRAKDTGLPAGGTTQTIGQTKIVWDDSNMSSIYANVSNAVGTREEIVLLFGMNQAWHSGQKEIKVRLTDRIIMSPYAAKRLSLLLTNVIKDYESRFGALEAVPQRPEGVTIQ